MPMSSHGPSAKAVLGALVDVEWRGNALGSAVFDVCLALPVGTDDNECSCGDIMRPPVDIGSAPGLELLLMSGGGFANGVRIDEDELWSTPLLLEAIAAVVMPFK